MFLLNRAASGGEHSGTVEYFHQDHLGSTRLKTNSTGGVVYDTNYVPFGPDQDEEGSEEFKYTGKHQDSTGLYYFGARYYERNSDRTILMVLASTPIIPETA